MNTFNYAAGADVKPKIVAQGQIHGSAKKNCVHHIDVCGFRSLHWMPQIL